MIVSKKLKRGVFSMEKIITGTILMVSLIMPSCLMADVTHKISGNITITKYNEGDVFQLEWTTPQHRVDAWIHNTVTLPHIDGNGTYPFEITCGNDLNGEYECAKPSSDDQDAPIWMQLKVKNENDEYVGGKVITFDE